MAAVASAQFAAPAAAPSALPQCVTDVYEEVADVIVLMGVFAIGWLLFNRLSVHFLVPRRPPQQFASARKGAKGSPDGAPDELTPCQAAALDDESDECQRRCTGAGKGDDTLDPASPQAGDDLKGVFFEDFCTPSQHKVCGTPMTAYPRASDSLPEFSDFSPSSPFDGLNLDFADGFHTTAPENFELPSGEGVDARMMACAERGDLAGCRREWRAAAAVGGAETLSSATCAALAAALKRAASDADADLALEAAAATSHAELADAALAAGARLRDAAWLARAVARAEAAGVHVRPEHLLALARAYGREGRGDLAADLWRERCASAGCPAGADGPEQLVHQPELYSAALTACVAADDFPAAWQLVAAARWRSPAGREGQASMLALARWLARHQGVAIARRCVQAVRREGGAPGAGTLKALLAASAQAGDMSQATDLFRELAGDDGSKADASAYSLMVRGYCAVGDVEQALRYFNESARRGLRPDAALFDALVAGCVARNQLSVAEAVLANMDSAGIPATNITLAALVRLHSARGALGKAMALFEDIPRKHGFQPDAHAYHALVTACLHAENVNLALKSFAAMSSAGCPAHARTYEALIIATTRMGDLHRAAALVEDSLGLRATTGEAELAPAAPPRRRAVLEPRVIEELLELVGRRRLAASVGARLIDQLQEAGVQLPERLAEGLRRAARTEDAADSAGHCDVERRAALQRWRNGFQS